MRQWCSNLPDHLGLWLLIARGSGRTLHLGSRECGYKARLRHGKPCFLLVLPRLSL